MFKNLNHFDEQCDLIELHMKGYLEMENEWITLNSENIQDEHLCCIIRTKKPHSGVERKRQWLIERLKEGHVFRKLNAKATVFIEYAPLESAWVPIIGDHFLYIYCLWVLGDARGKGYGKALMEACIQDAKSQGRSGICMLASTKQKAWLSDQAFAKSFGFQCVDQTANGYELLALSFDGSVPQFSKNVHAMQIENQELTIYYSDQCPYVEQSLTLLKKQCEKAAFPYTLIHVDTLEKAKQLPCVFNNFAVFYQGQFETVNLLDQSAIQRILKKSVHQ